MKYAGLIVLVLLTATFARAADEPTLKSDHKEAAEQQLVKLEHTWNEAMKNRDKAVISSVCSEDFLYTGEDGKTINRAFYIAELTTHVKVLKYTVTETTVRSYGDTGVVIALWDGTVEVDGRQADVKLKFTDTFVRRDNRWWAVASHSSRIQE